MHAQAALAEISRVLRPGGVFVASTFMVPTAPLGQLLGSDDAVRPLTQVGLLKGAFARCMGAWYDPVHGTTHAVWPWMRMAITALCAWIYGDQGRCYFRMHLHALLEHHGELR